MKFISTRGQANPVLFSEAVAMGMATDGGLFLPETLPDISPLLSEWESFAYEELCFSFLKIFATDIENSILQQCVQTAYKKFNHTKIAPLLQIDECSFVLELFHGPTLAFKDFALIPLGKLYGEQIKRHGKQLTILGATSGDTGSAAINGLLDIKGANVFILYPRGRISPLQERQMTCTGANRIFPLAIEGSFDDAQSMVKEAFADLSFRKEFRLSAINSINLARILVQCVYYIYAWFQLPKDKQNNVEFIVPTGNFGNILAGWLAKKMGLPIQSFHIATNQNDILYRLFKTGRYEVQNVIPSLAPSMDIQIASNFERFIYYIKSGDTKQIKAIMQSIKETKQHHFAFFDSDCFTASKTTDNEILSIIKKVYNQWNYLVDPHTACGFKGIEEKDKTKTQVVLATAHPAKFPDTIHRATGFTPQVDSLEQLKSKPVINYQLEPKVESLKAFIKKHVNGE